MTFVLIGRHAPKFLFGLLLSVGMLLLMLIYEKNNNITRSNKKMAHRIEHVENDLRKIDFIISQVFSKNMNAAGVTDALKRINLNNPHFLFDVSVLFNNKIISVLGQGDDSRSENMPYYIGSEKNIYLKKTMNNTTVILRISKPSLLSYLEIKNISIQKNNDNFKIVYESDNLFKSIFYTNSMLDHFSYWHLIVLLCFWLLLFFYGCYGREKTSTDKYLEYMEDKNNFNFAKEVINQKELLSAQIRNLIYLGINDTYSLYETQELLKAQELGLVEIAHTYQEVSWEQLFSRVSQCYKTLILNKTMTINKGYIHV